MGVNMLDTMEKSVTTASPNTVQQADQNQTNSIGENRCQFFNEMRHSDGSIREEFAQIQQWLANKSLAEIESLNHQAK